MRNDSVTYIGYSYTAVCLPVLCRSFRWFPVFLNLSNVMNVFVHTVLYTFSFLFFKFYFFKLTSKLAYICILFQPCVLPWKKFSEVVCLGQRIYVFGILMPSLVCPSEKTTSGPSWQRGHEYLGFFGHPYYS